MASIFLSYAREDAPTAKSLARCLERAGHEVWWDRNIHGGTEYAGEIEAALKRSDVVIVLWSDHALKSAWVRDEAAEGRDSGRLVPLLMGDTAPPLGFRQIQSVPIGRWSGRGNPPQLKQILSAVTAVAGHAAPAATPAVASKAAVPRRPAMIAFAALAALLIAVAGWFLLGSRGEAAEPPVLAVLPFADLSPQRDKAYFAEGVAEAILTVLAKEPGIRVVGRSTAQQLHEAGARSGEIRKALGVTHVLEGSARSVGDQLRMSVRLVDADDGRQLWAEEYQRKLDNVFAVQDEIGRAVAQRLRGSFAPARQVAQQLTAADTYALYLAARSKMRDRKTSSLNEALELAKRVVAADPEYAPGHAILAELTWHLSEDSYGNLPHAQAVATAERHARKAIQLAPEASEGYAALGLISSEPTTTNQVAAGALAKAIRLDPARAELRLWLASHLNGVGRHAESLKQLEAVVEMEPLWGTGVSMMAYSLAASDRYDEAEETVAKFEQRGGSPGVAARIRADMAAYRGDFSETLRFARLAAARDPETPLLQRTLGWAYSALGMREQAATVARDAPRFVQLYMTHDLDGLVDEARNAGGRLWQQPGTGAAIDGLALKREWPLIAQLYDAYEQGDRVLCKKYGQWLIPLHIATALQRVGRAADSRPMMACVRQALRSESASSVRSAYLSNGVLELMRAHLHALDGQPGQAFPRLERAITLGVRSALGRGLAEFPAFDPYRADPAYRRIDARLKQLIAAERVETLRLLQAERTNPQTAG